MKRVLVVVEDYNEMVFCETVLKKVGFDTQGMQRLVGLDEILLSFRPEGVLLSESFKNKGIAFKLRFDLGQPCQYQLKLLPCQQSDLGKHFCVGLTAGNIIVVEPHIKMN